MTRVESGVFEDWCRLREAGGRRVTLVDLYRLAGAERGLEPHELPLEERNELASRAMPRSCRGSRSPRAAAAAIRSSSWPRILIGPPPSRPGRSVSPTPSVAVAVRIDHVGSTSVPGLAGRSRRSTSRSACRISKTRTAGCRARSSARTSSSGAATCCTFTSARPHTVPATSTFTCARAAAGGSGSTCSSAITCELIPRLPCATPRSRELLVVWSDDRWGYTEAKSDCILGILDEAEKWAQATGWKEEAAPASTAAGAVLSAARNRTGWSKVLGQWWCRWGLGDVGVVGVGVACGVAWADDSTRSRVGARRRRCSGW